MRLPANAPAGQPGPFEPGRIPSRHSFLSKHRPNGVAARLRAGGCQYREFMAEADVIVWYNPRCSKCRGAEQVLAAYGVSAQKVFYLDDPPSRTEITRVLALLGATDPRALMRTAEPRYRELRLAEANPDELIDAMTRHPELIQRPVVIWADRAVIARPPELLLPLLETGPNPASP